MNATYQNNLVKVAGNSSGKSNLSAVLIKRYRKNSGRAAATAAVAAGAGAAAVEGLIKI